MCAALPPNQCNQLKIGRLLDVGAGRNNAPIGWRKQMIAVIKPSIAWGLSSADQPPISMKINTTAAIVRSQVSTMNNRCHWWKKNRKLKKKKLEKSHQTQSACLAGYWKKRTPVEGEENLSTAYENATYSKPLIFAAKLTADPGLFVISSK